MVRYNRLALTHFSGTPKKIWQRRFRIPVLSRMQFAGGFEQTRGHQDQRTEIPCHPHLPLRDRSLKEGIEMQSANQMQSEPRSAKLTKILHKDACRVDFGPPWLCGCWIVVEFKPHLPSEGLYRFGDTEPTSL